MNGREEKLLQRNGWEITGTTPLEITRDNGNGVTTKTGEEALQVLEALKDETRTSIMSFGSGGKYPAKKTK